MKNKELYEFLQIHAESTKLDKDIAFKKLNESAKRAKKTKKRLKPQAVFASIACLIVVALCVALPVTLIDDTHAPEPRYCETADVTIKLEADIAVLKNEYNIDALYPQCDCITVNSISSISDPSLKGAKLGYFDFDTMMDVDLIIIPKTHILQVYESYFQLENSVQWEEFNIKYLTSTNIDTNQYDVQIYFTDNKYDYFVKACSEVKITSTELLNWLYN